MSSFPNSDERIVASSLLLLQKQFQSNSNDEVSVDSSINSKVFRDNSVYNDSEKSSYSSLLINDKDEEIKSTPVSVFSATHRYHLMKFKIARKTRSKVIWTSSSCSGDWKLNSDATAKVSPGSISGEATSCLSNSSSGITTARSLRYANRDWNRRRATEFGIGRKTPPPAKKIRKKNAVGTPHLRRRGEAILKFLSLGGSSELRIREMLGDSPDTSKALRMLLRVDAVKRSGSGGRHDPYVYMITG